MRLSWSIICCFPFMKTTHTTWEQHTRHVYIAERKERGKKPRLQKRKCTVISVSTSVLPVLFSMLLINITSNTDSWNRRKFVIEENPSRSRLVLLIFLIYVNHLMLIPSDSMLISFQTKMFFFRCKQLSIAENICIIFNLTFLLNSLHFQA